MKIHCSPLWYNCVGKTNNDEMKRTSNFLLITKEKESSSFDLIQ
jgi:hypothetical protein